jgi:pheromone shutdown protein TraB
MNDGFKGTPNKIGRPKGSINKTSAEIKAAIRQILSNQLEGVESLLDELTPKDKVDALIKLLPYIIPKQNEVIIDKEVPAFNPITVKLIKE